MNTQQLECFVCVADKLNFTKAAEELFLSTPTVTHHIKNLEEELGAKLFIRNSKMVRLTEIGTMFYSDAKDILNKIEVSQKRISKATSQNTSFLRIGCSSHAELNKLKNVLSDLRIVFPQVYPLIFMEDYFKLKNLFNNKHLDIMLSTREMIRDMKECSFKKLKDAKNYAIISSQSTLAEKDSLTFDDLKANCLIILNPKFIPFQHGNILQEKIALHSQSHFNIVCENDQASILLANCGYGIAILPEHCIPIENDGFVIRPIIERAIIEYGIAYQKNVKEKYIRFFIDNFNCL